VRSIATYTRVDARAGDPAYAPVAAARRFFQHRRRF
jgi:hypothetical protein